MFLKKSKHNSSGPLLSMKVEKLFSLSLLIILRMGVIGGVSAADDQMKKGHPVADESFDFSVDLIMNCLP